MKKSRLLMVSTSLVLLLSACNFGGKGNKSDYKTDLGKALNDFGTNYTAVFSTNDGDDYCPTLLVSDNYFANQYVYQTVGYAKIAKDKDTYHYFDHYVEGRINEDEGEYIYLRGRRDFTDEDLKEAASLTTYFDETKFEKVEKGVYHSDDEEQILGFLSVVNTTMGYFMFGYGTGGIDITLDDGVISGITYYGMSEEEEGPIDKEAIWATVEFKDVGTTKDSILENYINELDEIPTPGYDDIKLVSRTGHNLYEGETYNFTDMAISSVVGENCNSIGLTASVSPYIGFETTEVSAFGTIAEHYAQLVDFTATIDSKDGHTILKDIKNVEYKDDWNYDTAVEICDAESYFYDFGDPEYAKNNNGVKLALMGATFTGGTISEQPGKEETINLTYTYCGKNYELPVVFTADCSQDVRSCWVDMVGEGLSAGSVVNVCDIMFRYVNGKASAYITESSSFEKGVSLADACLEVAGEEVPLYTGNLGVEFFYEMQVPGDDDKWYKGLLAIIDLVEGKEETMEAEYKTQLTNAGYKLDYSDKEDDTTIYQYSKGDIVVIFTSPTTEEGYSYYQLQIANLGAEIVEEEDEYYWAGTWEIVLEDDTTFTFILDEDGNVMVDGEDDTYSYASSGNTMNFSYKEYWFSITNNGDGTYSGYGSKDDSDVEFKSITRIDAEEE